MDNIFVHGLVGSSIIIISLLLLIFIINYLINVVINKSKLNNKKLVIRIKRFILISLFIMILFNEIKYISITVSTIIATLLASGGFVAIVVGLASQEAASSIISGFMLTTFKPFKIGDFVIVEEKNIRGYIEDISLRHTVIETIEKTKVVVPNTIMNNVVIENVTNIRHKRANILNLSISYESDIDQAIEIIKSTVKNNPFYCDGRSIEDINNNIEEIPIFCSELNDSSVDFRVIVYSDDVLGGFKLLSDLRIAIKKQFDKNGIKIPYPQVTISKKEDN